MGGTMEILNQILFNLQAKYGKINQLMDLTKELDKAACAKDTVSFGMVLDMRQKVMDAVDHIDVENRKLIARLPANTQDRIKSILVPGNDPVRLENPLETNIFDTNKRNILLVQLSLIHISLWEVKRGKQL